MTYEKVADDGVIFLWHFSKVSINDLFSLIVCFPLCDCKALTGTIFLGIVLLLLSTSLKITRTSFLEKTNCRDVLGVLILMLTCPLEHHFSQAKTTDSLMLVIKSTTVDQSSSPNSANLFGKVNKTFACFVVESLSVNLHFDCWFNHSS